MRSGQSRGIRSWAVGLLFNGLWLTNVTSECLKGPEHFLLSCIVLTFFNYPSSHVMPTKGPPCADIGENRTKTDILGLVHISHVFMTQVTCLQWGKVVLSVNYTVSARFLMWKKMNPDSLTSIIHRTEFQML